MPAIGKILTVFVSMLVLTRVRVQLGLALTLGGIVLNLWAGLALMEATVNFGHSLLAADLWLLLVITVMIIEIGRFLTEKDNANEIISAVQWWGGRHGRAVALMSMPAVIGLIPMPAGALFSAPFVRQAGENVDVSAQWKSAVNYWFRHVWEYWWPLYPGVIMAMQSFAMIETWRFVSVQMPFTVVAIASGYFFFIHPQRERLSLKETGARANGRRVFFLLSPVLVVVVAVILLPFGLKLLAPGIDGSLRKLFAMAVGLLFAIVIILLEDHSKRGRTGDKESAKGKVFSTLFQKRSLSVMISLAGVFVFKFLLDASGLLPVASDELIHSGIPLEFVIAALPFLAGLVTGISLAFVGASFPLIVGLMSAGGSGSGLAPLSTLVLAYGFGYMGMILSPVHLCLLVTKDYFEASMVKIYGMIMPCVAVVLVWSVGFYLVLRLAGL